jgi:hypothetical protein
MRVSERVKYFQKYLHTTPKEYKIYWHLALHETTDEMYLWLAKKGEKLPLEKYKI